MRLAGIGFTIIDNSYMEEIPEGLPVLEVALYLAEQKAEANKSALEKESDILITADSIVVLENEILGKPDNEEIAKQMVAQLSGKTHTVVTGVCMLSKQKKVLFDERAIVEFMPIDSGEIDYYVTNYKPFDKAGAYGIQEWLGLCKIKSISGNHSTIMGLPVARVYHELRNF